MSSKLASHVSFSISVIASLATVIVDVTEKAQTFGEAWFTSYANQAFVLSSRTLLTFQTIDGQSDPSIVHEISLLVTSFVKLVASDKAVKSETYGYKNLLKLRMIKAYPVLIVSVIVISEILLIPEEE